MAAKKKDPKPKKPKAPKGNGHPPKTTAKADVKIEHFTASLRCELSESEVVERSKRISRLLSDKAQRQEMAKAATAHLKAEIKQFDAEISKLAQEVTDSACYRDIGCERRFVYRTGKVVEVRNDTGVQTYERAMTAVERQLELPKAKSKPKMPSQEGTTKAAGETNGADGETKAADGETAEAPSETNAGDTEPPASDDDDPVVEDDYEPEEGSVPAE